MRLKCLSFDRKLCQNVVFGCGWDFPACLCWSTSSSGHAVVQEPPNEGTPVGLHGLVPAAGFAWCSLSERLVASEQFVSLSSALIMKLHSIRGPSSLCDCRNYHLPNWCEVPCARPAPPARTIRAGSPARGMLARSSSLPLCWNSGETSPGRATSPRRGLR